MRAWQLQYLLYQSSWGQRTMPPRFQTCRWWEREYILHTVLPLFSNTVAAILSAYLCRVVDSPTLIACLADNRATWRTYRRRWCVHGGYIKGLVMAYNRLIISTAGRPINHRHIQSHSRWFPAGRVHRMTTFAICAITNHSAENCFADMPV